MSSTKTVKYEPLEQPESCSIDMGSDSTAGITADTVEPVPGPSNQRNSTSEAITQTETSNQAVEEKKPETLSDLRTQFVETQRVRSFEFRKIARSIFITSAQQRLENARSKNYRDHIYQEDKLKFIELLLHILDNPKPPEPKSKGDTENQTRKYFQKFFNCCFVTPRADQISPEQFHQEQTSQEQIRKDPIHPELTSQEKSSQEQIRKEQTSQEQIRQEPIQQEQTSQEQIRQEPTQQEQTSQEQNRQKPIQQEQTSQEQIRQEPIQQEQTSQEQIRKEPISREQIKKLQDQLKKLLIKVKTDKKNDDKKKKNDDKKKKNDDKKKENKNDNVNKSDNFDNKPNHDFEEGITDFLKQAWIDFGEESHVTIKHFESWSTGKSTENIRGIIRKISEREKYTTMKDPPSILNAPILAEIFEAMLVNNQEFMPHLKVLLENLDVFNQHVGYEQSTPLHFAAATRNRPFLQWLLELKDIDKNSRNLKSQTSLYLLCEQWGNIDEENQSDMASIRECILLLLDHGADLNVWGGQLPSNLLRQHTNTERGNSLIKECKAKFASAIAEIKVEKVGKDTRRLVKFDDTDNGKDKKWTVELLEVLLRIRDQIGFETQFKQIKIDENNIRKVIRLLLHTAVQAGLDDSVNLILSICGKRPKKGNKVNIFYETDETNENKDFCLAYRKEWKGILRNLCEQGKDTLLPLFLERINDRVLLKDEPLLIITLNKANTEKEKSQLMSCAKLLVNNMKVYITLRDNSGNTALHVALQHGFEDIAMEILKQPYAFIGIRNQQDLTPLSYGSHDFWKKYFDQCIEKKNREDIFIDFHSISPFIIKRKQKRIDSKRESHQNTGTMRNDTSPDPDLASSPNPENEDNQTTNQAKNMHTIRVRRQVVSNKFPMNVKIKYAEGNKNIKPRESDDTFKKINEMDAIVEISKSDEHQQLLLHPMLYTFIVIKWSRLNAWNWINLFLSFCIALMFAWHSMSLHYYDIESPLLLVLCYVGCVFQVTREILQIMFLRLEYLKTAENYLDVFIIIFMFLALLNIDYSVAFCSVTLIGFAIQLAQVYGSIRFGEVSSYIYMFQTVTRNFVKCILMFCLFFPAFGICFAMAYKNASNESFASFWTSSVKIVAMTTGEFDAREMEIHGQRIVIFLLFAFFIAIVLMNLFNGIAVSDIVTIREQSELVSIRRKVLVLAQYESNLEKVPIRCVRFNFPEPFFREFACVVKVIPKEAGKILVQCKIDAPSFVEIIIVKWKSTLTNCYRHFVSFIPCTRNNNNQHNSANGKPVNQSSSSIVRQDIEPDTDHWQSVSNIHRMFSFKTVHQIESRLKLIQISPKFLSLHAAVGREISKKMEVNANQSKAVQSNEPARKQDIQQQT